jgi:S1-C subfamily serine protease
MTQLPLKIILGLATTVVLSGACKNRNQSGTTAKSNLDFNQTETTRNLRMGFLATSDLTVTAIKTASFAHVIGLQKGDRVEKLNGKLVSSLTHFNDVSNELATKNPAPWVLTVARSGRSIEITNLPEYKECEPFSMTFCGTLPDDLSGE